LADLAEDSESLADIELGIKTRDGLISLCEPKANDTLADESVKELFKKFIENQTTSEEDYSLAKATVTSVLNGLVRDFPFLTPIISDFNVLISSHSPIETLAVTPNLDLLVNQDFWLDMLVKSAIIYKNEVSANPSAQGPFLKKILGYNNSAIVHEIIHVMARHFDRASDFIEDLPDSEAEKIKEDPVFNHCRLYASDYEDNQMLGELIELASADTSIKTQKYLLPEMTVWPDPLPYGKKFEYYLAELYKQSQEGQQGQGQQGQGQQGQGQQGQGQQGQGCEGTFMSPEKRAEIDEYIEKQAVEKGITRNDKGAAQRSIPEVAKRMRNHMDKVAGGRSATGSGGSLLYEWAEDVLLPKRDWRNDMGSAFSQLARRSNFEKSSWARVNRRSDTSAPPMPGSRNIRPKVSFVFDTSGSVVGDPVRYAMQAQQVDELIHRYFKDGVNIITTDTQASVSRKVKSIRNFTFPNAGGGTDLEPGIDAAVQERSDLIMVVTDPDTYLPAELPVKLANSSTMIKVVVIAENKKEIKKSIGSFPEWAKRNGIIEISLKDY
jgi:predicted metal-dependent peptidase